MLQKMLSRVGLPEMFIVKLSLKVRKKIKKYLIIFHPFNKILVFWKAIFCLFLTFEMYSMTIKLFFQRNWDNDSLSQYKYYNTMSFLMIADILITLNTAFYHNGVIILSRRQILYNFIRTECLYDIIPLISFLLPIQNHDLNLPAALLDSFHYLIKLGFLLKFRQIGLILYYFENVFNFSELWDGIFSLLKLFAGIMMIAHLISCCWNLVALHSYVHGEKSWYDALFTKEELTAPSIWLRVYLHASYWSVMTMITVGYGDISPKSDKEMVVAILAMLFGCGFFAYAINNIGQIIEKIGLKRKNLR
jgi:hypothetical protein